MFTTRKPKRANNLPRGNQGIVHADAVSIGGLLGFGLAYIIAKSHVFNFNCAILFVVLTALPMLLLEALVYRVYRHSSAGFEYPAIRSKCDWRRCCIKYLGLCGTLAGLTLIYWLLPEYNTPYYLAFRQLAMAALPWTCLAAIPYIIWTDTRLSIPEDDCFEFGRILCGKWDTVNRSMASNHVCAWAVKGFFLPLMTTFSLSQVDSLLLKPLDFSSFPNVFIFLTTLFFTLDVIFATVGYLSGFRILDTHIRSVEPTLVGWFVTLLCYPPFNRQLDGVIFFRLSGNHWQELCRSWPLIFVMWGFMILVLEGIYCWSTVSFGLRFSNLTNRGIVITGPYRYLKHPAYTAKNMVWWLTELPFLAGNWTTACQACFGLALVSGLYYIRAKTEEAHLMADPSYRLYARWVDRFGVAAHVRRAFLKNTLFIRTLTSNQSWNA